MGITIYSKCDERLVNAGHPDYAQLSMK